MAQSAAVASGDGQGKAAVDQRKALQAALDQLEEHDLAKIDYWGIAF